MDSLNTIALISGAIWLGILTLVMLLVIRQIGILTIKLVHVDTSSLLENDGPELGSPVPSETLTFLPELASGHTNLLLISAQCMPCRELVTELTHHRLEPQVITLLSGREELADELATLLPNNFRIIRDPDASSIAETLKIKSTPFSVAFQDQVVVNKAYVYSIDTFVDFVNQSVQNKEGTPHTQMEAKNVS
jgi:hypothetical protein